MQFRLGKGSGTVTLDDGTAALARRLIDESSPKVVPILVEGAYRLKDDAARRWPRGVERLLEGDTKVRYKVPTEYELDGRMVKGFKWVTSDKAPAGAEETRTTKGKPRREHSADLFEVGLRVPDEDRVISEVLNPAKYLFVIKSDQHGLGGKSAFVELLRKPGRAMARPLAEKIVVALAKLAKEAVNAG